MKKKRITVKIDTTYKYLGLWNGLFNLTPKELRILAAFIDINRNQTPSAMNACNIEIKKLVAKSVGIKDHNTLNNYVKRFKDKGVMLKKESGYVLNKLLEPDTDSVEILIKHAH